MIAGTVPPGPASASGRCGKRRFSRNRTVWSSGADNSSVAAISAVAKLMRGAKRRMTGDDVARQHRLLIVEAQPVAQLQGPDETVRIDLVAGDHLRLRRPA